MKPEVIAKNAEFFKPSDNYWVMFCDVYGHPKHEDGKRVVTSQIQKHEGNRVETLHTIYTIEED